MSDASRLPLYLMIGVSVLAHGLFLTGLPNLPWFQGPPDVFRLTRYVVRFAKPVPTAVPTVTQVAAAEPVAAEPAPVEPVPERQVPEPVERVETPDQVREQRVAPAKPVVLEPLQPQKPRTAAPRERVVARTQPTRPDVAPVQPAPRLAAAKPQPRRPTAAQPQQPAAAQPQQPAAEVDLQAQAEHDGAAGAGRPTGLPRPRFCEAGEPQAISESGRAQRAERPGRPAVHGAPGRRGDQPGSRRGYRARLVSQICAAGLDAARPAAAFSGRNRPPRRPG